MRPCTIILDAPADAKSRLQIATLGDYNDKRYGGDFSITRDDVESWRQNLEYLPGKRALIDLDHRADRTPRNTEAAGWITDVGWDGETPIAEVEWTPVGKQAIEEKRYLFFSPTYGAHRTEDGTVHENTLIGGALTNRPFLSGMPAITLASEETINVALDEIESENNLRLLDVLSTKARKDLPDSDFAIPGKRAYPIHDLAHARNALARVAQNGTPSEQAQVRSAVYKRYPELKPDGGGSSDSRRAMDAPTDTLDLGKLRKALGLDKDADPVKILEAATSAAEDASKLAKGMEKKPVKTLEQQAKDAGLILLDADAVRQLQAQATAGDEAMKQLHAERFDRAFTAAIEAHKVTPEQRESFERTYKLDADLALKMLDEAPAILPDRPFGAPVLELDQNAEPAQVIAAGRHPGSHELHQRIEKYLLDNSLGHAHYSEVAEKFMNGQVRL